MPFLALGVLNRLIGRRIQSVFFCYAGSQRYAEHYSYRSTRPILRWFPSIIGVFEQGDRRGVMCASPVIEAEFTHKDNALHLNRLLRRLELVRALVGAGGLSLSGILPTFVALTPSYHALHHARYVKNYGLITPWFDRLFGTQWPDVAEVQTRAASGEPLRHLAEGRCPSSRLGEDGAPA